MGRSEEIARLVRDAGGVASAAQITEAGFLPGSISHALKSGAIEKLTRGVYCLPEVFDDELAAVTYRWRKCVLSHGSALLLASTYFSPFSPIVCARRANEARRSHQRIFDTPATRARGSAAG